MYTGVQARDMSQLSAQLQERMNLDHFGDLRSTTCRHWIIDMINCLILSCKLLSLMLPGTLRHETSCKQYNRFMSIFNLNSLQVGPPTSEPTTWWLLIQYLW